MPRSHGFSTLETLMWIGMFVLTMGAIMSSILYFYRVNAVTINQASSIAPPKQEMERMVRPTREAAFASDGAYPVISLADNQFAFYADVDADAFIEKVRYYLNGTTIVECIVNPSGDPPAYTGAEATSVISDYVRNTAENLVMFTYFDEDVS